MLVSVQSSCPMVFPCPLPPAMYSSEAISFSLLSEKPIESATGSSFYSKGPVLSHKVLGVANRKCFSRLCHAFLVLLNWNFNT